MGSNADFVSFFPTIGLSLVDMAKNIFLCGEFLGEFFPDVFQGIKICHYLPLTIDSLII